MLDSGEMRRAARGARKHRGEELSVKRPASAVALILAAVGVHQGRLV
jgi:hypothetical protein